MENLNEGKKGKSNYMAELAEIDAQSAIVAMEAKINKLEEMAAAKEQRLSMVSEDENLSELISKSAVKEMQKEIKEIRKMQEKLKKVYEKKNGKKTPEMVDEYDSSPQMIPDEKEDGTFDMSSVGMKEEEIDEASCGSSYEEDGMKEETNEEFNRFRKLAGTSLQENISSHKEEAKRFLEKFINDNEDAFEFIPDMSKGYINAKDNSYNVDELASIFLDMGQDIPRGKYNQKYKGEGGTYVVVAEDDSVSEGGYDSNYEEDDSMNEEFLRMQKLAGVISEEEYKKKLNEEVSPQIAADKAIKTLATKLEKAPEMDKLAAQVAKNPKLMAQLEKAVKDAGVNVELAEDESGLDMGDLKTMALNLAKKEASKKMEEGISNDPDQDDVSAGLGMAAFVGGGSLGAAFGSTILAAIPSVASIFAGPALVGAAAGVGLFLLARKAYLMANPDL